MVTYTHVLGRMTDCNDTIQNVLERETVLAKMADSSLSAFRCIWPMNGLWYKIDVHSMRRQTNVI